MIRKDKIIMAKSAPLSLVRQGSVSSLDSVHMHVCPVCGGMTEGKKIGKGWGWTCLVGGYAHYYQARYAHLERWFTSGEGNLREPLIQAMNPSTQTT